jgi:rieske iron-sulfur protein
MTRRKTFPFGHSCTCRGCWTSGNATACLSVNDAPAFAERRSILKVALAAGGFALPLATAVTALAQDAADQQKNARPKEGDLLVFAGGDKQGQVIRPADIEPGSAPVMAWPMDPASKTVRDGSRLNQVLLLRLDPASLDDDTRAHAAEGIVAYSAICTHAQCPVAGWNAENQVLHCQCHQSDFDPRRSGRKVSGPAPRALPGLPVKIVDGVLTAAGAFLGRAGSGSV